jgi:hypothetical protein
MFWKIEGGITAESPLELLLIRGGIKDSDRYRDERRSMFDEGGKGVDMGIY